MKNRMEVFNLSALEQRVFSNAAVIYAISDYKALDIIRKQCNTLDLTDSEKSNLLFRICYRLGSNKQLHQLVSRLVIESYKDFIEEKEV